MDTTELFSEIANRGLARLWAQHPSVQASVQASSMRTLSFPLKLNSLVRLPEDYSELVNNVSTFSCPNVGVSDGCRVPAMCLICGKVICSQSYCCQGKIKIFFNISCMFLHFNNFSNLNYNCSNLLDMRNLEEQVKKSFYY